MAVSFFNEIKVHGSRKNLTKFKVDIAGNSVNGPLSFHNIIPDPLNNSKLENEYQVKWRALNWGCQWDAIGTEMNDEDKFLVYTFGTRWSAPVGIYDKLIEKYSELDFDIYYSDDCIFSINELASRKGKLTENYYFYWECITLKDGKYKDILNRQDRINNIHKVIEEHIFIPGEYDEGSHRWLIKDVKFSEVNGVAIYESMSSEENIKLRAEVNQYNSPPVDGTCMCCGRHVSELSYAIDDNSEEPLLIIVHRPMFLPDQGDEKISDKSDGQNDPLNRLTEDYQDADFFEELDTDLFEELKESWECRDCAVLSTDEYFVKLKNGYSKR